MSEGRTFKVLVQNATPMLHRIYCECERELTLPQGVWHEKVFKWHYKCECGVVYQSRFHFPRIEYEILERDGSKKRFTSSGYPVK